jgi:hypothetical protein
MKRVERMNKYGRMTRELIEEFFPFPLGNLIISPNRNPAGRPRARFFITCTIPKDITHFKTTTLDKKELHSCNRVAVFRQVGSRFLRQSTRRKGKEKNPGHPECHEGLMICICNLP